MTITYEERLKNVFSLEKRRLQQAITTAFKYAKGQCKEERNGLSSVSAVTRTRRKGPVSRVRQEEMLLRRDGGEGLQGRLQGGVKVSVGGFNDRLCKYLSATAEVCLTLPRGAGMDYIAS